MKSIYDKQEYLWKLYFENSKVHSGISLTIRKPLTGAMKIETMFMVHYLIMIHRILHLLIDYTIMIGKFFNA